MDAQQVFGQRQLPAATNGVKIKVMSNAVIPTGNWPGLSRNVSYAQSPQQPLVRMLPSESEQNVVPSMGATINAQPQVVSVIPMPIAEFKADLLEEGEEQYPSGQSAIELNSSITSQDEQVEIVYLEALDDSISSDISVPVSQSNMDVSVTIEEPDDENSLIETKSDLQEADTEAEDKDKPIEWQIEQAPDQTQHLVYASDQTDHVRANIAGKTNAVSRKDPDDLPENLERPIEWHIEQSIGRHSQSDGDPNQTNHIQLDIQQGKIVQSSGASDSQDLITMMNNVKWVHSLASEKNFINQKSPTSWKPSRRNKRVHSDPLVEDDDLGLDPDKRPKWASMQARLNEEPAEESTPTPPPNLKCDESSICGSSDDLASSDTNAMPVSLPSPKSYMAKDTLHDLHDDGNSSMENSLEATEMKVRGSFRQSLAYPDANSFDFLHWQSNKGVLFGSSLNFFINDLGLIDINGKTKTKKTKTPPLAPVEEDEIPRPTRPVKADDEDLPPEEEFWQPHMERRMTFAAPEYFFQHTRREPHNLRVGMTVEVVDPKNVTQLTTALVAEVSPGIVMLSMAKSRKNILFHNNSWRILPVNTARHIGMPLVTEKQPQLKYMPYVNPALMRKIRKNQTKFKENHHLEAYDMSVSGGHLRPAVVRKVILDRVLIQFRSFTERDREHAAFWCRIDSPLIVVHDTHVEENLPLVGVPADFTWGYACLGDESISFVHESAFCPRKPFPYRVGMQLEAVDRISPHVMRPATVTAVSKYELQIEYDGFKSETQHGYRYWIWDDSEDIFPVGWCNKNFLVFMPPNETTYCPRKFCGDVGHKYTGLFHSQLENCPYSESALVKTFDRDWDQSLWCTVWPKFDRVDNDTVADHSSKLVKALKMKLVKQAQLLIKYKGTLGWGATPRNYTEVFDERIKLMDLPPVDNPLEWNVERVKEYIDSIPQCRSIGMVFYLHAIDGEALLSLTEEDLKNTMSLRMGFVTKIYTAILKLRQRATMFLFKNV